MSPLTVRARARTHVLPARSLLRWAARPSPQAEGAAVLPPLTRCSAVAPRLPRPVPTGGRRAARRLLPWPRSADRTREQRPREAKLVGGEGGEKYNVSRENCHGLLG